MKIAKVIIPAILGVLLVMLVFGSARAFGQSAAIAPDAFPVFVGTNGVTPVALGFVCTTASGGSTPKSTYQDSANVTANQNPIRLNAGGQPVNGSSYVQIFLTGLYRFTVYSALTGGSPNCATGTGMGAQVRQVDPVFDMGQLILSGAVTFTSINNRQYCATGTDAGAKIAAAIAAGPSTGVFVDCSNLQGAQTINQDVFASAGTKPVHLLLGAATFTVTVTQNCPSQPVIIEGIHAGSGNAPPLGTVLAGSAALGATSVIKCADLNSRWSEIRGLNISTAASTSAIIISNLATNLSDVFVASTTAAACEINNSVAAVWTNVHCSGLGKGLWLHPQGDPVWDIALNTFISSSGGCPTNAASNTGAIIEGFTQAPENYFINFDVEGCGTGVSSGGSQSHFVGLHTESNATVGLVETATAQSTYLSRKNNDGASLTASTCYNDIAPRTSPKINHYCDKFDTLGVGVTPNAIVPLGITAISTGGSSGIVLYPDNSTLAVAALFSATNAGVRFGTLTLGRGNSGAVVTTITGDPAGVEIMGAPVSVVSGTASAPAIFGASFTTTGLSFSAGPLLSFDVNGAEKIRIDTTNDAVSAPIQINFAGTFKTVQLGAADSGGAGYKLMRVVN